MGNGAKVLECEQCGKTFNRGRLVVHERIHRNEKPFTCQNCEKSFRAKEYLKAHSERVHLKLRPFRCQFCDKGFVTNYERKQHTLIHSDVRQFPCSKCGRDFRRRIERTNHRMTAHPEVFSPGWVTKWYCEKCGKAFQRKSGLRQHIGRYHERSLKVTCPRCKKVLGTKGALKVHLGTVCATNGQRQTFLCTECPKTYMTKGGLFSHRMKKHTDPDKLTKHFCRCCGAYFMLRQELYAHDRYHHQNKGRYRKRTQNPDRNEVTKCDPKLHKLSGRVELTRNVVVLNKVIESLLACVQSQAHRAGKAEEKLRQLIAKQGIFEQIFYAEAVGEV